MNEVLHHSTAATAPLSTRRHLSLRSVILSAFLLLLWGILCRFLGIEWSINEQYNYGWFVPFFALYLFWMRWETRPSPMSRPFRTAPWSVVLTTLIALLLLLPLRLFEVAIPDWRLLGWVHAAVAATLTFFLLWSVGGAAWVRHFAFPLAFFFVAVPWLLVIETPIVQGLMRIAAMFATEAAGLCGIPAQVEGNLIRLNTGVVGVNEACSGVRSLQTSLMIGLLFGDLARLSKLRRLWLILGALLIALLGNFGRAFFLVLVAAGQGPAAIDRWHDTAGYTILAVVFLGSMALMKWLGRAGRKGEGKITTAVPTGERPLARAAILPIKAIAIAFSWLIAVEIGVEAWYRSHERNLVTQPRWTVRWPGPELHGHRLPIDERVKRILRFDEGGQATLALPGEPGSPNLGLLFFFRWEPGSTSILRARGHRPDICLPSSGWTQTADLGLRFYRASESLSLPFRHYTFKRDLPGEPSTFTHAFFCIYEDRLRAAAAPGTSEPDATTSLVTSSMRTEVVAGGLRNPGQQVLELLVLSEADRPATEIETRFGALLPSLVQREDSPAGER